MAFSLRFQLTQAGLSTVTEVSATLRSLAKTAHENGTLPSAANPNADDAGTICALAVEREKILVYFHQAGRKDNSTLETWATEEGADASPELDLALFRSLFRSEMPTTEMAEAETN